MVDRWTNGWHLIFLVCLNPFQHHFKLPSGPTPDGNQIRDIKVLSSAMLGRATDLKSYHSGHASPAAEDITSSVRQVHGDWHLGLEKARRQMFPNSRRCRDFAHVIGANQLKRGSAEESCKREGEEAVCPTCRETIGSVQGLRNHEGAEPSRTARQPGTLRARTY